MCVYVYLSVYVYIYICIYIYTGSMSLGLTRNVDRNSYVLPTQTWTAQKAADPDSCGTPWHVGVAHVGRGARFGGTESKSSPSTCFSNSGCVLWGPQELPILWPHVV